MNAPLHTHVLLASDMNEVCSSCLTSPRLALSWSNDLRRLDLARRVVLALLLLPLMATAMRSQTPHAEPAPLVIEGVQSGNVYEINRAVEVRGRVGGVIIFGGDLVVRGRVDGDVATIGGSVHQAEGSYISGDVIVLGGAYRHGETTPNRSPASATVIVAGFEEELRSLARSPASLLAPKPTPAYFGGRLLAVLFWFVVSLGMANAVPDAVGRAGARLRLTSLRVALIGLTSLVAIVCGVPLALRFLPAPFAAFVVGVALFATIAAYLFGRVVLHVLTGQVLRRRLFARGRCSESWAMLTGVTFWVALLSLPYVWTLLLGGLLVVSFGLTLTARAPTSESV